MPSLGEILRKPRPFDPYDVKRRYLIRESQYIDSILGYLANLPKHEECLHEGDVELIVHNVLLVGV